MHGTIDVAADARQQAERERAWSLPLEQFDPGDPELYRTDSFWPYFDRLRREDRCITARTACSARTGR